MSTLTLTHAKAADQRALGVEITDLHHRLAIERVLGDMDAFADWLTGECAFADRIDGDWCIRFPGRIGQGTVAQLAHVALGTAGTAEERVAAMDELRCRYLAEKADWIKRLEAEFAEEGAL